MVEPGEQKITDSETIDSRGSDVKGNCLQKPKKPRRKLKWFILAAVVVCLGGIAVNALVIEPHGFKVTRHTITLPRL